MKKELEELSNGLSQLNEQEKREDLTSTYAPVMGKNERTVMTS